MKLNITKSLFLALGMAANVFALPIVCPTTQGTDIPLNTSGLSPDGCIHLDKTFSNFAAGGSVHADLGGASQLPGLDDIQVFAVGTNPADPAATALGLQFRATDSSQNWLLSDDSDTNGMLFDAFFTYSVTTGGTYLINGAYLGIIGTLDIDGTWSGAGAGVQLIKEICPGTTVFSDGCAGKLTLTLGTFTNDVTDANTSGVFAGASQIAVRDRWLVNYGTDNGSRSFDLFDGSIQNRFTQQLAEPGEIPEPATYLLLGCGLAGLAMLKRRVRSH